MPRKSQRIGSQWLLFATINAVRHRFWSKAKALPRRGWQRWASTLLIGLGLCALLMLGLTLWAKHSQALQVWDRKQLSAIPKQIPMTFSQGVTWQSPGNLVGMVPVVVLFATLTSWFSRPLIAASAIAAYGLQFSLVWIGWGLWSRERPDFIANGIAAPGLHSFPSGHATVVTVVYGFLFYLWFRSSRRWGERLTVLLFALLWISLVSLSRLVLGAHWPSDIIAGLIIGVSFLITVILAVERAEAYLHRKG